MLRELIFVLFLREIGLVDNQGRFMNSYFKWTANLPLVLLIANVSLSQNLKPIRLFFSMYH